MSSLLQNLVEESISDGLGELDGDVKTALELIKKELLGDIRDSLQEGFCFSQVSLHERILCFEKCEKQKQIGSASCGSKCDGSEHKSCRDELFGLYKEHIEACRNLDHFVYKAKDICDNYEKTCCYLPHTTWNCAGPCKSKIAHLEVDDAVGKWMQKTIRAFQDKYDQWDVLYKACRKSYRNYVEKDADCDCKQAECESRNCQWDSCHYTNCEHTYQKCWGGCEVAVCTEYPKEQCLEKDRKIDWSATEKIECYVDVLMANPTKDDLLAKCGTEDCINKWREQQYLDCNKRCPEVDTLGSDTYGSNSFPQWGSAAYGGCSSPGVYTGNDNECIDIISSMIESMGTHKRRVGDEDVSQEGDMGVTTHHRRKGGEAERCTDHLDLDWQMPPCCTPCEERDSPPCEGGGDYSGGWDKTKYMWTFYGQHGFLDTKEIGDFDRDKCWEQAGEHTYEYAYNLCECTECPPKETPPCPTCVQRKGCDGYGTYDYSAHYPALNAKCEDRDDGFRGKGYELARQIAAGKEELGALKSVKSQEEQKAMAAGPPEDEQ
jgi:hypothetical protein